MEKDGEKKKCKKQNVKQHQSSNERRIAVSFIYLKHSGVRTVWANTVTVLQKLRQGRPIPGITAVQFASKFSHRNYS